MVYVGDDVNAPKYYNLSVRKNPGENAKQLGWASVTFFVDECYTPLKTWNIEASFPNI